MKRKAWGWVQVNSKKGGFVYGEVNITKARNENEEDLYYIVHGSFYDLVDPRTIMSSFPESWLENPPENKNKKDSPDSGREDKK